ncbi:MAG: DUF3108 domain-containing protein [Gammaproteobacteria bacterium]|nr:DUF3108 domain-containing protein [Gammaproteobacteria bacterium]
MKTRSAPILATVAALLMTGPASAAGLTPYVATYSVAYSSMSVGESRMELHRDSQPGRWAMTSRSNARGLARLVAPGELVQSSWIDLEGARVRPLRYRFDDGGDGEKNVSLDFDWAAGRVKGTSEGKPVDVAAVPGLQDSLTLQVSAALTLGQGGKLESLAMIEKDKVKLYRYVFERRETLTTPLGKLDTLVYRSERSGSDRYSRLWYAPALGYVNVRAEQFRGDKRLFSLQIKTYKAGD